MIRILPHGIVAQVTASPANVFPLVKVETFAEPTFEGPSPEESFTAYGFFVSVVGFSVMVAAVYQDD